MVKTNKCVARSDCDIDLKLSSRLWFKQVLGLFNVVQTRAELVHGSMNKCLAKSLRGSAVVQWKRA